MGEPRTLMEIFEEKGWLDDDEPVSLSDRQQIPMGDPKSQPTQMVDLLVVDAATSTLLSRFVREDGISQGQVLAAALKLYAANRRKV